MKKTATITINGTTITINELTTRQLMQIKDSISGGGTVQAMETMLPLLTDATPEFLLDLAPSELVELYDKVKEVNSAFFTLFPLEKMLAGFHGAMLEMIQGNLSALSATSLPPVTEQQSMTTD